MLQAYVINLDRHPERLFEFYQQPDAHVFQRVPAVDKKQLELLGDPDLLFNCQQLQSQIHRPVTLGEIGCTLSHIKTWKRIAANPHLADEDFAIVAEDDVKLIANFAQNVTACLPHFKPLALDFVILQKLGLYTGKLPLFTGGELHYSTPQTHQACDNDGSSLYLIRKSQAKRLLDFLQTQKPFWLADHFSHLTDLNRIAILNQLFGYIPENAESDLEQERELARKEAFGQQ